VILALSLAALALGPLVYRLVLTRRAALALLDSFTFVAISGLVLLQIIPHSIHRGGWVAALAAAIGVLGPVLAEESLHRAAEKVHRLFLAVAMLGLGVHSVLDGMALAAPHEGHGETSLLALAVIIHQVPVGLTVWWLLVGPYGVRVAGGTLGFMAAATALGFFAAGVLPLDHAEGWLAVLQAFVGGSLVHVVVHRTHGLDGEARPLPRMLGALIAAGILVFLLTTHHDESAPLGLTLAGAPVLLIFLFLRFGPHAWVARVTAWRGRGRRHHDHGHGHAHGHDHSHPGHDHGSEAPVADAHTHEHPEGG